MNWLNLVSQLLSLAPLVIQGIQAIHGEKDHATKTQMAHDALQLASGVAVAVDPKDQSQIKAASLLTHAAIQIAGGFSGSPVAAPVTGTAVAAPAAAVAVVEAQPAAVAEPVGAACVQLTPTGHPVQAWK